MRRNTRKRSTFAGRAIAVSAALALGAGGVVVANQYASAGQHKGSSNEATQAQSATAGGSTIGCPDIQTQLTNVPQAARTDVARELALLDQQVYEAYKRLGSSQRAMAHDQSFAQNAILGPLQSKRVATLDRIGISINRVGGERPQGLESLAPCALVPSNNGGQDKEGNNNDGNDGQDEEGNNNDGQDKAAGPVADDFADITTVQPNVSTSHNREGASRNREGASRNREGASRNREGASKGTFATQCGVNENKVFNTDNIIVAPGVSNGAHHLHDYVGNQANNAFTSREEFLGAETSCKNQGDKSSYYWPVLRVQDGTKEFDVNNPGGGTEGNIGKVLSAKEATMKFVGSPVSDVVAMPVDLRIITGDAKAFVNGPANANTSWSCTGFEDRQLKDKYPLCPEGSDVVRTFKFQSCWDGQNTDSANHRTHVAFADPNSGACPNGFRAIPQLVQRLVYDVDAPSLKDNGQTTPLFAVDGFPEQLHKPITDHSDFVNFFDENVMNQMVQCINSGQKCG